MDLETVLDAYVECAFWSSVHFEDETSDGVPFDEIDAELAPEALASMRADVEAFMNDPDLADDLALWDDGQVGHDLWLTRNGHGTGFWDRGKGTAGERLSDAAHAYGTSDLYLGDDGKVYVS
jgi:hypothetical protein